MKHKQKIVLVIFIPVLLFFIAYTFAYYVSGERTFILPDTLTLEGLRKSLEEPVFIHNPLDWRKTWYVWLFSLALCLLLEYIILFEDKLAIVFIKQKRIYLSGNRGLKMNKIQKVILAIFVPVIFYVIAYGIGANIGSTISFNLEEDWYIWMCYFVFCCIFEYKLFGDKIKKKELVNNKKENDSEI